MKVNLIGKTALVTGAGREIGRAIADSFGENGATVLYTDVDTVATRAAAIAGLCRDAKRSAGTIHLVTTPRLTDQDIAKMGASAQQSQR